MREHCTKYALQLLNVVHKKIIRAISGVGFNAHTHEHFNNYSFSALTNINVYMVGFFVYKCINDVDFLTWFTHRFFTYPTRLDQSSPVCVPRISSKHSEQCITYIGAIILSNIPLNTRNQTYNCFKIKFKRTLLFRQGDNTSL